MKRIYLDYASLTPTDKRVMKEVKKYGSREYTNPASIYASGVSAKKALIDAKKKVAGILHAHPDEIIFTSGGTESNNIILEAFRGKNIIISAIEHSSIIKNADATHISVDINGLINLEELKKAITADTALVSIMYVNNEIGSIQNISEIAKIVRDARKKFDKKIFLHTDACQAPIHLPLHVEKLGVDMITLDGNKMYGPRGVGMIYVKRGTVKISRAGTENLPAIMGFACALDIAEKMREKETKRILDLKNYFIRELNKINPAIKINGDLEHSVPNIMNISILDIDNEFFILQLDAKGVECSTKSACLYNEDESYVLKAMGVDSKNVVRFSFGRDTTKSDIKKTLKIIANI